MRKKNETHNVKKKPQFKGVAWANPLVDEAVGASASTAVQGEHEKKIKLREENQAAADAPAADAAAPPDDAPADVPADGAPADEAADHDEAVGVPAAMSDAAADHDAVIRS